MIVIIQARSGSKRFKNKVLKLCGGKPLIWHVIKQIKKNKKVRDIVVAIPNKKKDLNLLKYLKSINVKVYRGDEDNVARRMLFAAKKYKAKNFMRISGDSPLIKPSIINKCILLKKKFPKQDIITNVFPRSFPSGQSTEIINTKILEKNIIYMNRQEKEHVTTFFYNNSKHFKIKNFSTRKNYNQSKHSIDTLQDYNKLKKLIKNEN